MEFLTRISRTDAAKYGRNGKSCLSRAFGICSVESDVGHVELGTRSA